MYLKSLELTGFKSFAKKTVLQFTTPITAIVGPNGSGKSNIAEAFRFALGEQSIKSMRGKRTEDLIWNGSPELGRSNRAGVKLTLDNHARAGGKRLLSLDFDEASLERVIYRDSSSEYALNGSQVRLRDIMEVLGSAHIGASGHHIISQGEADRILNANARERREMIEDALGLKVYQWKREESEKKLEKTEENMKQVQGLRKEIAPHLAFLKKQVEKLEKVQEQKNELRDLLREYFARERAYLARMEHEIAAAATGPKVELAGLDRALSEAKKTLEKLRGSDIKTKAIVATEEKQSHFRHEREGLLREAGRLEGEIAGMERLVTIEKEKASAAGALVPLASLEELVEKESTTLEKLLGALRSLITRYRSSENQGASEYGKALAELQAKKTVIDEKLRAIGEAEAKASAEAKELRLLIESEKDTGRDAEKELFRIVARQNELRSVLAGLALREQEQKRLGDTLKRDLAEGAILVGREVLETENKTTAYPPEDRTVQEERRRRIEKLKIRIEDAGAGGGAETLTEFNEASERDQFLERELTDLLRAAESLRSLINDLAQKLNDEFQEGIGKINAEFQKFFALMFGGGTASLSVVKKEKHARVPEEDLLEMAPPEEEEEEEGIEIGVSLPRKKIKGLMMLSGGERALTSIALLFAMSQVKPPPFIILDETDAALDEANSRKYGDMVENLSKHSQLILITHNRETMSRAGVIYGVTMDRSGVSKLLSIAFEEAAAVAK